MNQSKTMKEELPFEKFLCFGPKSLTNIELLAIILRTGTCGISAKELAEKILTKGHSKYTGLNGLHSVSIQDLMTIPGIGQVKAVQIKCIEELALRMSKEKAQQSLVFYDSSTVAMYYMDELRIQEEEVVLLLLLDVKYHLLRSLELSRGTINFSAISPREIFKHALRNGAFCMILMHNHPSGDPTPSKQDVFITKEIQKAGDFMDMPLLDHIIIGDGIYYSMKEKQIL